MPANIIPYIADAVCVILLVLVMRHYAKKGIYECLMPFIVLILSLAFAIYGSNLLTKPVTDKYVFPRVEEKLLEKYDEVLDQSASEGDTSLDEIDTDSLSGGELEEIKEKLSEFAGKYGLDFKWFDIDSLLKPQEPGSKASAPQVPIKDQLRQGLLDKAYEFTTTVVHWVLFAVLVLAGLLIFNLLKKLVGLVTKLPIISFFNAVGGIIIGAALFTVLIFIASRLLRRFGVDFLDRYSQGTYVLNWFMSL